MWEGIRDYIDKLMSAQNGWFLLLFGGICLYLIWRPVAPFDSKEAITAPVAGFLLVLGAVTLIVRFGAWVSSKVSAWWIADQEAKTAARAAAEKDLQDAEDKRRKDAEALRNLAALTYLEDAQLQFILHKGQQRVDLPVEYGLLKKHILIPVGRDSHFVDVRDVIWEDRAEILRRWRNPPSREFPARHF